MARKINAFGAPSILGGTEDPIPDAHGVDPKRQEALNKISELADEVNGLAASVKREKEAKDTLKGLMREFGVNDITTDAGVTAKVIESHKDSVDEEALIKWAKSTGRGDLVKTITIEQIDMEAVERLVYGEVDKDSTPVTDAVTSFTTTSVTYSLKVSAPKAKKEKEAK